MSGYPLLEDLGSVLFFSILLPLVAGRYLNETLPTGGYQVRVLCADVLMNEEPLETVETSVEVGRQAMADRRNIEEFRCFLQRDVS